jgi:Icc-related predicted phosphoesterase
MIIAEIPSVIIISLKKETATTVSVLCVTGFCDSNLLIKIKSKKAMLQMIVNFDRKEITFIKNSSLKYTQQNNINLLD